MKDASTTTCSPFDELDRSIFAGMASTDLRVILSGSNRSQPFHLDRNECKAVAGEFDPASNVDVSLLLPICCKTLSPVVWLPFLDYAVSRVYNSSICMVVGTQVEDAACEACSGEQIENGTCEDGCRNRMQLRHAGNMKRMR